MFTMENTSGFTKADLELMNLALQALVARGMSEKSAADRVNNNWQDSNTVESLTK